MSYLSFTRSQLLSQESYNIHIMSHLRIIPPNNHYTHTGSSDFRKYATDRKMFMARLDKGIPKTERDNIYRWWQ